jgi:hypothetical protein
MADYKFTLRNDTKELNGVQIGRFYALFSETDLDGKKVIDTLIPPYVKIGNEIFKSKCNNGGNYSIFIAPGVVDPISKDSSEIINYVASSKADFFYFKLRKDQSQKLLFWGLLIAMTGVMIDSSFAIGKIHPLIPCSELSTIGLLLFAMILKIAGLWLAFKKGFWDAK